MNAASGTVVPISAMPFGVVTLPTSETLNPILLELFGTRARADVAGAPLASLYRSQDDLFLWPQPEVRQLAEEMSRGLCSVVLAVNEFDADVLNSFSVEARAWFDILEKNSYVPAANFSLTAWCAVYCVGAPEASDGRADSGVLRIYESRLGTMFHDVTTASMRIPYRPGHYAWRPVPGQMAVFSGASTHEIALLRSAGQLVLVTARFRFVAPDQSGLGRW